VARISTAHPAGSQPDDTAQPKEIPRHPSVTHEDRQSGLFLKLVATAWLLSVLLAVLDEVSSVPHGAAVLAWSLSMLMGIAIVAHFEPRRRMARNRPERETDGLDQLTGLLSFRSFKRRLTEELHRVDRYGDGFLIVLADVNHLNATNREYGEDAGDQVLRHVARCIEDTKRFSDIAARVGDDEFGIILQGSDEHGAKAFVRRLEHRLARESAAVEIDGRTVSVWVGICAGVAVCGAGDTGPEQALSRAVANLRAAKEERDRRRSLWVSSA
jgi:diguanylate cyclase (GGDEF)-like protein